MPGDEEFRKKISRRLKFLMSLLYPRVPAPYSGWARSHLSSLSFHPCVLLLWTLSSPATTLAALPETMLIPAGRNSSKVELATAAVRRSNLRLLIATTVSRIMELRGPELGRTRHLVKQQYGCTANACSVSTEASSVWLVGGDAVPVQVGTAHDRVP